MKKIVLAALTVLSLGAGVANAQGFSFSAPQTHQHSGPYDNTGHGPQETGLEGGGG
jgi:hypothetical protein